MLFTLHSQDFNSNSSLILIKEFNTAQALLPQSLLSFAGTVIISHCRS